jgi:hypothetical protein
MKGKDSQESVEDYLNPRFKQGFECEGTKYFQPTGIHSISEVFCYPQEVTARLTKNTPVYLLPNIISLLLSLKKIPIDETIDFLQQRKIFDSMGVFRIGQCKYFYDSLLEMTFLLFLLDYDYIVVLAKRGNLVDNDEITLRNSIKTFFSSVSVKG